ncbi:protein piccolo-like isoform X2 [Argopecten irradians]|uniref:protein piccolo-like isoform X2 n=1 Tax=Argopecten irradians TaxID=31199 RepID=UPI00371885E9
MLRFPCVLEATNGSVVPSPIRLIFFALWHCRVWYLILSYRRALLGLLCFISCAINTFLDVISTWVCSTMGNETSSIPSDCTTPTSEWQSVQSFGSKRRSSVSSTRLPTPTDPPEPDLAHLSEEEIKQIRSVIGRAKELQEEEQKRIRDLEQDYTAYALTVEQRAQSVEPDLKDVPLCPLCMKNELRMDGSGMRKGQDVCVDCEKLTCAECGSFEGSLTTRLQEWVCTACLKRRKLVLSTGMWHPGVEPTAEVPLSKQIETRMETLKDKDKVNGKPQTERNSIKPSADKGNGRSSAERSNGRNLTDTGGGRNSAEKLNGRNSLDKGNGRSERGSKHSLDRSASEPETVRTKPPIPKKPAILLHQHSLPNNPPVPAPRPGLPASRPSLSSRDTSKSTDGSRESLIESPVSEDGPSSSGGQSRLRGVLRTMVGSCAMGHGARSDSETSASDVDMEDVSMHYYQGDGMSTDDVSDDYSMMSIGSSGDDSGRLRRKLRPRSLNIPRSHSATSSDDETTDSTVSTDTENRLAPLAVMNEARVALAASAFAEEMEDFKGESSVDEIMDKYDSDVQDDLKSHMSPSPPRSPSWRAGLESPPFSPKRRDSYPGKKRPSSPVSPKDSRLQFTYDVSPPVRQLSVEEMYAEAHALGEAGYAVMPVVQKPSPISPEELADDMITTMGEPFLLKMPESKPCHNLHELDTSHIDLPDTVAIDLATYAATIASNTANLTQMTVSPTNLQVLPVHDQISPDSQDTESTESASPISPSYYENGSDDLEEVELADPSSKAIDYQGSKRQKVRPPSTDWSPVIDLSPILDVSPSIEEAERVDMFEKQEEERRRRESQEEDDEDDDDEDYDSYFQPLEDDDEKISYYGLKRYDRVENICQLLQSNGPTLSDGLNSSVEAACMTVEDGGMVSDITGHPFTCATIASKSVTKDVILKSQASISEVQTSSSTNNQPKVSLVQSRVNSLEQPEKGAASSSGSYSTSSNAKPIEPAGKPPKPPIRPRRKLPEPTAEMIAAHTKKHMKSGKHHSSAQLSGGAAAASGSYVKIVPQSSDISQRNNDTNNNNNNNNSNINMVQDLAKGGELDDKRKKAKDMKAKPNPLVIRHIESEEQSMSPQYKVLDSPPSPESRSSLKRDYSDSTSVSPSSSPDREVYPFPSPVTPPDSDSSPPKPHSPSSPGTDFDEDSTYEKPIPSKRLPHLSKSFEEKSLAESKVKDKIKKFEQVSSQETKKTRRKLPPIPTGEEASSSSKQKSQTSSSRKHHTHVRSENRRKRTGYGTPSSTSDESMNEDDFEVAMWTNHHHKGHTRMNDLDKPASMDKRNGNYITAGDSSKEKPMKVVKANIPLDKDILIGAVGVSERNDQRSKDREETDEMIDSMINIYGVPITQAMKSLKKRLQDELRKATEGRRRRIEEFEEIRALQLQIGELKLSSEYAKSQLKRSMQQRTNKTSVGSNGKKRGTSPLQSARSSPQVLPRRSRHKRQTSDPMISKFSPIKEDKDVESDFQSKGKSASSEQTHMKYITDDSSQSGLSDNESIRSEPVSNARYKKIKPSAYAKMFFDGSYDESKGAKAQQSTLPGTKSKSRSESHIPQKVKKASRSPSCFGVDEEMKVREDRKQELQNEIEKRKKQLEETSRLQAELLNLTRTTGHAMAHSYDDLPRTAGYSYPATRPIPTGIIKPLEDDEESEFDYPSKRLDDDKGSWDNFQQQANYSSTEYLAHKQETSRRSRVEEMHSAYSSPFLYSGNIDDPHAFKPTIQQPDYFRKSDPIRDPVMSSSVTLPELHSARTVDIGYQTKDTFSDTEASPPSDPTPAMPLLDDVKARSRKIIHDIGSGSRPVSAEFNFTGGVDDLMNAIYRAESDNSVDADEPIMKHMMEGGVTILKQLERKKPLKPSQPKKYDFPTKRILLTRDPKDRSIKGNGIGMKIVGGKTMPWTNEVGAYVTAIYPGGVAEQLHGELQEGDQIVEWNGIELTYKTYEEVQQIIGQPNGEIELVVRPSPRLVTKETDPGSCHSSYDNLEFVPDDVYEKCIKSNHGVDPKQLAAQLEGIQEKDSPAGSASSSQPEFLTPSMSSPCSSPRSDPTSTSSDRQRQSNLPGSTERERQASIVTSTDRERQASIITGTDRERQASILTGTERTGTDRERKPGLLNSTTEKERPVLMVAPKPIEPPIEEDVIQPVFEKERTMGDIQLQLSHDDLDSTLSIHIIAAKNLISQDMNGLSDPFVKVYLLPGRCAENKRRTKHISKTLCPEWYQTVVFQDLHREELQYKTLEITVWDYDRFKANDFLGEVIIDLSVPGFLDNLPHWYPLREHDNTTGVELPKPTVLPPTVRSSQNTIRTGSPAQSRGSRDSPSKQYKGGKNDGLGGRRRSLGALTDVDRLTTSESMDISSTHSSPLLPHKPRDMHLQSSEHAPGKVVHCFSGLSHILSVARHFLYPRSKKNKYCARLSHRLLPKKNSENRLLRFKLLYLSITLSLSLSFSLFLTFSLSLSPNLRFYTLFIPVLTETCLYSLAWLSSIVSQTFTF